MLLDSSESIERFHQINLYMPHIPKHNILNNMLTFLANKLQSIIMMWRYYFETVLRQYYFEICIHIITIRQHLPLSLLWTHASCKRAYMYMQQKSNSLFRHVFVYYLPQFFQWKNPNVDVTAANKKMALKNNMAWMHA